MPLRQGAAAVGDQQARRAQPPGHEVERIGAHHREQLLPQVEREMDARPAHRFWRLQCRKRQPDKVAAFRAASEPEQEQLMLRQA